MTLHITKVAVGCTELDTLRARMEGRADDGETYLVTRFRPKRESELVGGSVYWIIKHRLVARQEILGFTDDPDGKRCRILLSAELRPVRAHPKRAHQGWRYLPAADAPPDLGGAEAEGLSALPGAMAAELAALALI
ncbi:DUF1489 domain-containing protein [Sphingomonas sp. CGMCC 1.13654]|uniref:DUF1489 domain-containing protein n=1 Tax=Sphingomonas chungangi TaxID=2683589 RepID=A0A838L1W5_9SPHN|nr:DUF1489 domain-containing protein [Sphingomonas chungangi]MBA2932502.1 DUF1489 domain-containing protein [Sphingomonas chungangi]MVW56125.1 DUF1489 family protein [Sphingomonas chungangi]